MGEIVATITTIVITILGSGGFWTLLQTRSAKNNPFNRIVLGLGHDKITYLGEKYVERGYVTFDEYENLCYMWEPYRDAGGNGSAKRIMEKVEKLPHKKEG